MEPQRAESAGGGVALAPGSSADEVLDSLRSFHAEAVRRERSLVVLATQWARLNPAEELTEADILGEAGLNDEEAMWLELSRHGCTHIDDLSIPAFAAAAGTTEFQARRLIRESLLLVFLLPRVWERAASGDLEMWRARRLAEECWGLHPEALAYIDRNMSLTTARHTEKGRAGVIEEAKRRFMATRAREEEESVQVRREVLFDLEEDARAGIAHVYATMDLLDARDLKAAVEAGAAALGSDAPLGVRRAWALGDLARASQRAPARPLTTPSDPADRPRWSGTGTATRDVKVFLHLTPDALVGGELSECTPIRVEGRGIPAGTVLTAQTVRQWFTRPGAGLGHRIKIRPVLDLEDHIHVDAYEVPERIKEQAAIRDGGCVFPWCTRKPWFTDCDHIIPWKADGSGGPTCSCNTAPLCRRHHRAKTHADNHVGSKYTWWNYESLGDGKYLWRGPKGTVLLRTNTGVREVSSTYREPPPTIAAAARTVARITETIPPEADFHDRYPRPAEERPYVHYREPREPTWREIHSVPRPPIMTREPPSSRLETMLFLDHSAWLAFTPKEEQERLRQEGIRALIDLLTDDP